MTLIPTLTLTELRQVCMEHLLRGVACKKRERLFFRTPVPPFLGLAYAPIVETRFLELAMSLLDFSPWLPHWYFAQDSVHFPIKNWLKSLLCWFFWESLMDHFILILFWLHNLILYHTFFCINTRNALGVKHILLKRVRTLLNYRVLGINTPRHLFFSNDQSLYAPIYLG